MPNSGTEALVALSLPPARLEAEESTKGELSPSCPRRLENIFHALRSFYPWRPSDVRKTKTGLQQSGFSPKRKQQNGSLCSATITLLCPRSGQAGDESRRASIPAQHRSWGNGVRPAIATTLSSKAPVSLPSSYTLTPIASQAYTIPPCPWLLSFCPESIITLPAPTVIIARLDTTACASAWLGLIANRRLRSVSSPRDRQYGEVHQTTSCLSLLPLGSECIGDRGSSRLRRSFPAIWSCEHDRSRLRIL